MTRAIKQYDAHYVKTFGDQGIVQAVVAIFGTVDLQGDRVIPGAFMKSLRKWKASGKKIPVIFSHDWLQPLHHIGYVTKAQETAEGLEVEYKIDLDTEQGAHIFRLIKEQRLVEHSWAYDIVKERRADDGANDLLEVDLLEVGPTLKGAHPDTRLIAVKSDRVKDGHGHVIMDESAMYPELQGAVWHIEERGLEFAVVDDEDGQELGRFATRGAAVAMIVELLANARKSSKLPTDPTILDLNDRLAELLEPARPKACPGEVEALIQDVREELIQEALDRAEQAAWDERMLVNLVRDPLPVRVDARMRPDRS